MKSNLYKWMLLGWCVLTLITVAGPSGNWQFPRDHGVHHEFNVEWWYLTGHITDQENRKHGLQVTFFRNKVEPVPDHRSVLNSNQVYVGHVAWTDIEAGTFKHDERLARPGLAKVIAEAANMNLQVQNWRLYQKDEQFFIDIPASFGDLHMQLRPTKKRVFHGQDGKSYKGPNPDQFSYYYSYPRLEGRVTLNTREASITSNKVSLWMDREIFDQSVNDTQQGWDWFAIQFDDGTELMCFQVRGNTSQTDYRSGTYITQSGKSRSLTMDDISFTPLENWTSPKTGITYPLTWQIRVPSLGLNLRVEKRVNNQELHVKVPIPMAYWEGSCEVTGSHIGSAYMELVGYGN